MYNSQFSKTWKHIITQAAEPIKYIISLLIIKKGEFFLFLQGGFLPEWLLLPNTYLVNNFK